MHGHPVATNTSSLKRLGFYWGEIAGVGVGQLCAWLGMNASLQSGSQGLKSRLS